MGLPDLSDDPEALTAAARQYLREKFLRVKTAVCGANFLIADTGGITIVESEGNGRMCLTLPETLIAIVGIEKVIPRFADLEVLLQTLPRSATGERMNPYNSIGRVWCRATGRRRCTSCCSTTGGLVCCAMRSDGRRCSASVAAHARTCVRCTGRPVDIHTDWCTPGRSARY